MSLMIKIIKSRNDTLISEILKCKIENMVITFVETKKNLHSISYLLEILNELKQSQKLAPQQEIKIINNPIISSFFNKRLSKLNGGQNIDKNYFKVNLI